jgi:hypothetical protein
MFIQTLLYLATAINRVDKLIALDTGPEMDEMYCLK